VSMKEFFKRIIDQPHKGFGSKLMEKITEIAELNNIKKIELDFWVNNDIAKDFYIKNGFKKYREFVFKEI
jgi:diamine N-acetyltransferase